MFSGNSVCVNTAVYENVSSYFKKLYPCRPCNSSICITFAILEMYIMCHKNVLFHYSTIILLTSTYIQYIHLFIVGVRVFEFLLVERLIPATDFNCHSIYINGNLDPVYCFQHPSINKIYYTH